jgi:hypothetical protein
MGGETTAISEQKTSHQPQSKRNTMIQHIYRISLVSLCAIVLNSCAIGQSKIAVTHSPLAPPAKQRSGTIVVRTFTDSRKDIDKILVGNKRNGYGMVLGSFAIKGGKSVAEVLTGHFADALTASGYKAVVSDSASGSAVLSGDIHEFWLDFYMAVWHSVGVNLQLKDGGGRVVWSKDVTSKETNVLWLGGNSEMEKVIRQSLDKALNQTVQDFASDAFAAKVR